jgi:hypothetical protein
MRSTELHGERRGWNPHLVGRVVRLGRIFLEVWIFRNVGNEFQNFVSHQFSAAPAKRENGVPDQDHAGARLVLMADFVNSGVLDQFSRSERAIALIKCFDVGVLQFHSGASFLFPSLLPGSTPPLGSNSATSKMGCVQGSRKLEHSG